MAGFLTPALRELRWRVLSTNPQSPAYWLQRMFGGASTATGKRIDGDSANMFSAFFAGTRAIAQDVGTLPFHVFRRESANGKSKAREHPAWPLLNRSANPEMGASAFRQAVTGQAVGRGDGYAEIEWDGAMRPRAFWPLRADSMRLVRNGRDVAMEGAPALQLVYLYTLPDGQEKAFAPSNILHIKGFSPDGLKGYSIVALAREGIAIELAAQEYLARFFANDATPGITLNVPKDVKLSPKALSNLRESFAESHEGLSMAHRMAILESGITASQVGMSHEDAEFMATRRFSVTEMARWFRLPPHILSDLERSTNNNIEHQGIEYEKFSIRPWCVAWEQELALKNVCREPFFAEHNMEGLARGDMAARAAFYHSLRQDGAIRAVDIMERENLSTEGLPPVASELWMPLNMVPASAYDQNGMTMKDRADIVANLVRVGFDPMSACKMFDMPMVDHTGLVPTSIQLDPTMMPKGGAS